MTLRLVMQETLLPLVAVALSAVSACSSTGQRSSLPADFEFVSVSDEGLRAYRCGNETVDFIETYARVRPRIEETLGRQNMGDVPEVIDLSEISLVGLHRDQDIKLVSYLLTAHLHLHETISGEVGLAAVVEPCLEKVVHVYSLHVSE